MTNKETILPPDLRSPETVDEMCDWLRERGVPCSSLHEDSHYDEDIIALFGEDLKPSDLPGGWAVNSYADVGSERIYKVE